MSRPALTELCSFKRRILACRYSDMRTASSGTVYRLPKPVSRFQLSFVACKVRLSLCCVPMRVLQAVGAVPDRNRPSCLAACSTMFCHSSGGGKIPQGPHIVFVDSA